VRLLTTAKGIARQRRDGLLELLDLTHPDVGALLRNGADAAFSATVIGEVSPDEVRILAPVLRPGKIVIAGGNYVDHVDEAQLKRPQQVPFVVGSGDVVIGPGDAIVLPQEAPESVDYEGEVALVIGKFATHIPAGQAADHIAGLTIVNDVTARDVQHQGIADGTVVDAAAVVRGKQFPTFKPMGPAMVTFDEFDSPLDLRITTTVNGQIRQDARTTQMIFSIAEIVEAVSAAVDLDVGDIVLTGTPAGVALATGEYLRAEDTVEITVENLGVLTNTVAGSAE
jgi:2-keto-4-pentenoate hydratase/2-oxohepta-3-ene-1,7-dioic acid hydratase in catechol pathway